MMNSNAFDTVRYSGIEFSPQGAAKVYGARIERFIARAEIREIHLKNGRVGERRLLQILFAIALLGWAVQRLYTIALWLLKGGTMYIEMIVILVPLLGVGGWLLWDLIRPQWYFEVRTLDKTYQLIFERKIDKATLAQFLNAARQLGYMIDIGSEMKAK